jgi:hypothetical protein
MATDAPRGALLRLPPIRVWETRGPPEASPNKGLYLLRLRVRVWETRGFPEASPKKSLAGKGVLLRLPPIRVWHLLRIPPIWV